MEPNLVDIGQTIVHGVLFDPKNGDRVKHMDLNELYASAGRLFDLLEEREIEYVLVGGIAMLAYVEGRNTQDIDLILSRADLAKLPELKVEDENTDFARTMFGDLRVDVLFAEQKLFKVVSKSFTTPKGFVGRSVPCATKEGLLAMKLFALPSLYRQGRFSKVRIYENDVAALIEQINTIPEKVFLSLEAVMLASDISEVRTIADEIIDKIKRSKDRFS